MTNYVHELARTLQKAWADNADNPEERKTVISLATSMGEVAWMSCPTPQDLMPVVEIFESVPLKKAFLFGLSTAIDLPSDPPSAHGNALRPYVHETLKSLDFSA